MDLEQELAHHLLALLQHELLVDARISIDELASRRVDFLECDEAVLHEPFGDAVASSAREVSGVGEQWEEGTDSMCA